MSRRGADGKVLSKNLGVSLFVIVSLLIIGAFVSGAADVKAGSGSAELFKRIQMFSDAITLINSDYVKKVEIKDLVYGAIRGMMQTLDGYSQFLDEESFQDIREETKGEFGGIGVEIGIREGFLTVITPIEGTPAAESGISAGDKVVKINGDITRDITLDEAVRKLRGVPGTEVSITVMSEDGEMSDMTLKRAVIKLKSVKEAKILSGDIAYIKLVEFQERTARDMDSALWDMKKKGAKGLVLDLRNNPGGLLDSAIEVSEKFLEKGTLIVYTEGREVSDRTEFLSRKDPEHSDMNIVVLINKGSASAAEIVAGALGDNNKALLVGETSFGKGSVQTVIPLRDKAALRLTTAAYYTPSGRNLMDKGIEPDIIVTSSDRRGPKGSDEPADADEKTRVFERIEKDITLPDGKNDKTREAAEEKEMEDEQIRTAVNILRGARVFEANRKKKEEATSEKAGADN